MVRAVPFRLSLVILFFVDGKIVVCSNRRLFSVIFSELGTDRIANVPNRGKHRAHVGQARCPNWASTVPNFVAVNTGAEQCEK